MQDHQKKAHEMDLENAEGVICPVNRFLQPSHMKPI